jgi:hypothetical protein
VSATNAQSPAAFVDTVFDFLVRERLESLPLRDLFSKCPKIFNGSTDPFQGPPSFGDNARYRFVVPRNDDFFATSDAVQELTETNSCFGA